jgi:hypothetical protein
MMSTQQYWLNEEFRAQIDEEIASAVRDFEEQNTCVIETVRRLSRYASVVERQKPALAAALYKLVGVDSMTDAIPIGKLREMWHPSTAAQQDEKLQEAENRYRDNVRLACQDIMHLLNVTS